MEYKCFQEAIMSAIAGIYNLSGVPVSIEQSGGMMKAFEKFPADDIQTWHKENIFLGCHAQWITPESIGEQLPFYDYQRQLAITADAIIDNREELFERLQIDREDRKKITDSQLILLAYHKWGEESPKFLVGDFAFMIWDEKERKLFGARDFSGARTLYYYRDNQRFGFSTTIQPLFSLPGVKRELNEEWLAEFIAISGVVDVVDTSMSVYKKIEQLPPSHSITIETEKVKLARYSYLKKTKEIAYKSKAEYIEAFQEIFQRAIKERIRTHKGVGAHLSGGLDSGAVASFASRALQENKKVLHTYSYIPPSDFVDFTPKYRLANERSFIESTVTHVGGLDENFLDFKGENPFSEINDFLDLLEMPYKFFENSIWIKGIFEQAQKDNVGLLLNGGRGNLSISWGPALEYYAVLLKRLKWISLYKEIKQYSANLGVKERRTISYVTRMAFPFINKLSPTIKPYQSRVLINSEFAEKTAVYKKLNDYGLKELDKSIPDIFSERKKHFEQLYHWNATNTLGTKLSLRYGLWKRDPTNDLRVIQFCLSIPEEQYVQNGLDRALIRNSTENYLPDKVRLNQRYRGVQGVDWVHRTAPSWKNLINELEELEQDSQVYEYLDKKVVKSAIHKIKEGPKVENSIDPDYRIAIRSLIIYRFLKKIA